MTSKENKIRKIVVSYLKMMFWSVCTVIFAIVVANLFNTYHPLSVLWINILESTGYVCWGTSLGALSRFRSTPSEHTAELFNQKFNTFISLLGIFVFSIAQVLRP